VKTRTGSNFYKGKKERRKEGKKERRKEGKKQRMIG